MQRLPAPDRWSPVPLQWIRVYQLLSPAHSVLPLKILRDSCVRWVAYEKNDSFSGIVGLGGEMSGIVLEIVVVSEMDAGN